MPQLLPLPQIPHAGLLSVQTNADYQTQGKPTGPFFHERIDPLF